jgi:hypothetical protein
MQKRLAAFSLVVLVGVVVMPLLTLAPPPVSAAEGFAAPAFRTLWTRTDLPVEDLSVKRTWLWGPQPLNTLREPYRESPGGERLVQYFDKSRMEINNPATNEVTNGLLATELIRGRLQKGDNYDQDGEERGPAQVNVAGDDDDTSGPTYASLRGLLGQPALPVGTAITETINRAGFVNDDPSKAGYGVTAAYYVPETQHSVASVFWDYLQTTGPVVVGNSRRNEKLFEPWYAAVGLPISRAYWARVKVAGVVQDVLIQAFERRVLTYTPANPPGWRVEMGNIGRHYYKWRYGQDPAPAGPTGDYRPLTGPHIGYGFNGFFTFMPVADPNSQATLARSLDLVKEADFSWIRQQVVWATLEPQPGQIDVEQLAAYDAIVREANQRRIGIMFSITKSPRWAVASDEACHDAGAVRLCGLPQDPRTLARLMGFLADRYKDGSPYGRVRAWEVWNEQNTGGETGNNVDAGAYVEVLKASYTAIKAADPKAIVVYGGLTPTGVMDKRLAIDDVVYLEQTYQYNNGEVKRYFDVLGAHPGSNNNPPDALWPDNPGPGTGCVPSGNCWRDHPSFYFRRIEQLRAVMEKYGDAQYGNRLKQIWLTEFGWSTFNRHPGYEYGSVISEELQAQYLVRAFEKGQRDYPWMGVMFMWTLNHSLVVPCEDEKYPWSVLYGGKCPEEIAAGKKAWDPRPAFLALKNMPKP